MLNSIWNKDVYLAHSCGGTRVCYHHGCLGRDNGEYNEMGKNDKDWGIVACLTTGEGGDWRGDRFTLC